jgi:hypothetical protein
MSGKALLVPALAALLLGAAAVVAQQEGDSATVPAPADSQQAPAGGAEQTPAPAPARKPSPSDYRASEEISEDLPVSFPVDI